MLLKEQKYSESEYRVLVADLLQSPDWDIELNYPHLDSVLNSNRNFFLNLFREVDKLRDAATQSNDDTQVLNLDRFKAKLLEYTDTIPADLPESILSDRQLIGYYLTNQFTATIASKWPEFRDYISKKTDEILEKYEVPFLKWCEQMLYMNQERFRRKVGDYDHVRESYDRRIQLIKSLIEKATAPITLSENYSESSKKPTKKIQWLGNQKELAELFVELKKKGWIEKFENETIQDCFTESNSVPHYLKPGTDTKTGEHTFENLYSGYSPQFYGIKENPKRNK